MELKELIASRTYLLGFQKEQLTEDVEEWDLMGHSMEDMERILDTIFYKLFGKGWSDLADAERREITKTLSGFGYKERV